MVLVSIIVPVYNSGRLLENCINSILRQSFEDFELLLVDDGSTDDSGFICDSIARHDKRVRVIHKDNSGVSDTRNFAIKYAKGQYIQFVDSDDYITLNSTKVLVNALTNNPDCDMAIARFYRVVGRNESIKGDIKTNEVISCEQYADYMVKSPADYYYGVLWNKLFKKEIIEKYDIKMHKSLNWCEDFVFNMEYITHINKIATVADPVYFYVKREGSLVSSGLNIPDIIKMKINVYDYYDNFYKVIYNREQYKKKKPEIYRFLIDFSKDEFAFPLLEDSRSKMA